MRSAGVSFRRGTGDPIKRLIRYATVRSDPVVSVVAEALSAEDPAAANSSAMPGVGQINRFNNRTTQMSFVILVLLGGNRRLRLRTERLSRARDSKEFI